MSKKTNIPLSDEELDWVQLRQDLGPIAEVETTKEKLQRKIKENPLVPIGKRRRFLVLSSLGYINQYIIVFLLGCLATSAALTAGLYNFRTGNRKMSQLMMRSRIAAQGFTVLALIVGVVMTYSDKK
ncbi:hypothetical protein KR026_002525 [Drosophila bipectinata]|nr:hypothetical protein KR026_002525 [Drosophila bipectinata]